MTRRFALLLVLVGCGSPTPAKPSERVSITVPAGDAWAIVSTCRADWTREEKQQRVERFMIDRDPVSCDEWNACVVAGKCENRKSEVCEGQAMLVRRRGAEEFCKWHDDARLATLAEWSRAARGGSKALHRDEATPCLEIHRDKEQQTRCAYTGPTGMRFTLTTDLETEWTSDDDCVEPNDGGGFAVAVGLGENGLRRIWGTVAAFRCARPPRNSSSGARE